MTSTSFAAMILAGTLAAAPEASATWTTDYIAAAEQAAKLQKPMAVFIAHGKNGVDAVVAEGKLAADATKALANGYVCVYVDTDTANGKTLAASFEMTEGVVLSGKGGVKQALRHEGTVPGTALAGYLTTYANPAAPVATTEVHGAVAAPMMTYQPAPAAIYGSMRARSSCPNCR